MAVYKVIQDIEAEDKLVGPLTLRQFIYAGIAVISGFIAFKLVFVNVFLITPFVPVVILFGVLAAPFGHDQSNEVWLLARVRFALKARKRIWNQSGISSLVTITAPKRTERNLTKNLSQNEVSSRLEALANTIDSRGWAIKNVAVNLYGQTPYTVGDASSDRLVDPSSLPQDVPAYDVSSADDILDTQNNVKAQQLDQMISESTKAHKQDIMNKMADSSDKPEAKKAKPSYWFMNSSSDKTNKVPKGLASFGNDMVAPGEDQTPTANPDSSDMALLNKIKKDKKKPNAAYGHTHVLLTPDELREKLAKSVNKPSKTTAVDPAILGLALSNNDNWSVATIAHQAQQAKKQQQSDDEVVVSLH